MDLLDVDFLQDLLEILEEKDLLERDRTGGDFGQVSIEGTIPGFDKDTQYNTIIEDTGQIFLYREVNGIISIRLPITANARWYYNRSKRMIITVGDGDAINIIK